MEGVKERFGQVYCLHLQNQAAEQYSASCILGLLFDTEDRESAVLRDVSEIVNDYKASHIKLFIVTNAGTSDLTLHFSVFCKLFSGLTEDGIQSVGCRLQGRNCRQEDTDMNS
jgi:hypothetical protein